VIKEKNIDMNKPMIIQCGSGVSATLPFIALKMAGMKDVRVFDGSWREYSADKSNPIVKSQ